MTSPTPFCQRLRRWISYSHFWATFLVIFWQLTKVMFVSLIL
jgi:hypothetical protein